MLGMDPTRAEFNGLEAKFAAKSEALAAAREAAEDEWYQNAIIREAQEKRICYFKREAETWEDRFYTASCAKEVAEADAERIQRSIRKTYAFATSLTVAGAVVIVTHVSGQSINPKLAITSEAAPAASTAALAGNPSGIIQDVTGTEAARGTGTGRMARREPTGKPVRVADRSSNLKPMARQLRPNVLTVAKCHLPPKHTQRVINAPHRFPTADTIALVQRPTPDFQFATRHFVGNSAGEFSDPIFPTTHSEPVSAAASVDISDFRPNSTRSRTARSTQVTISGRTSSSTSYFLSAAGIVAGVTPRPDTVALYPSSRAPVGGVIIIEDLGPVPRKATVTPPVVISKAVAGVGELTPHQAPINPVITEVTGPERVLIPDQAPAAPATTGIKTTPETAGTPVPSQLPPSEQTKNVLAKTGEQPTFTTEPNATTGVPASNQPAAGDEEKFWQEINEAVRTSNQPPVGDETQIPPSKVLVPPSSQTIPPSMTSPETADPTKEHTGDFPNPAQNDVSPQANVTSDQASVGDDLIRIEVNIRDGVATRYAPYSKRGSRARSIAYELESRVEEMAHELPNHCTVFCFQPDGTFVGFEVAC